MLFERLTFAEAVTDLANKAGVELRHEGKIESAQTLTRKLVCMLYNSLAASINNNCKDQLDKMFVHTLDQRYVPAEWQERFQLGFAQMIGSDFTSISLLKNSCSDSRAVWPSQNGRTARTSLATAFATG